MKDKKIRLFDTWRLNNMLLNNPEVREKINNDYVLNENLNSA